MLSGLRKIRSNADLQMQMSIYVTSVVLVVSTVILIVAANIFRQAYEAELEERIQESIESTSQILELKMRCVEGATDVMATLASAIVRDCPQIDSMLSRTFNTIDDVQAVSVIFDGGVVAGVPGHYERYVYAREDGTIQFGEERPGDELLRDPDWREAFVNGRSGWALMRNSEFEGGFINYHTPICNPDGERIGIAYVSIEKKYITSLVTKYKARKDIDVSIYASTGEMFVAPDEYILLLAPEDLIVQERKIEHLGWNVVFSADRNIVDGYIRQSLLFLSLTILLLFAVITLSIFLVVKYVAAPFVRRQRRTESEKAALDREMQFAAGAQNALVPHRVPPFPERGDIDLYACLHPAREVGGDLYDYFISGGKLFFCIGDVSGKGVPASLFMAATHYLFRNVADGMAPAEAVRQMNRSLCADNEQCMFVTFWFGCLDLETGELIYVNAGHNEPVLVRDGRAGLMERSGNMPLGVFEGEAYSSRSITLSPSDRLLLYTDGVTEAMDANGTEYGSDRMLATVNDTAAGCASGAAASEVVDRLLADVRRHAAGAQQSDDITMLCIGFEKK